MYSREFLCQRLILYAQGWELITKPECLVIRRPAPCFTGTTSSVKGLSELLRYTNFVSSVLAHSTESLHERYKSALYLLRGEAQWVRTSENKRRKENSKMVKWPLERKCNPQHPDIAAQRYYIFSCIFYLYDHNSFL